MHKCSSGGLLSILNFSQPTNRFGNLDQSLTKRGLESVCKFQKRICLSAESVASKGGGLGVFIAPLKTSRFLVVAKPDIPDTFGMTCTAPMVTELKYARC